MLSAVGKRSPEPSACQSEPSDLSCPGPLCIKCTWSKDQNQAQEGEAGSQVRVRPEVKWGWGRKSSAGEETASPSLELCGPTCRGASVSEEAPSRALLLGVTLWVFCCKQGVNEWTGNVSCGCVRCKVCNISWKKALGGLQIWTFLIYSPNLVPWFLALVKMSFSGKKCNKETGSSLTDFALLECLTYIPAGLSVTPSWADLKVTSYCVRHREYSLKRGESPRDLMKTLRVPITARASSISYYLGKKYSQTKEDQTYTHSIGLNFFWKALKNSESVSSSDYRMISRVPIFLPVSFSFSFSNIMELTADFLLLN